MRQRGRSTRWNRAVRFTLRKRHLARTFEGVSSETLEQKNMSAKKILITGGAGFVGSHVADALLAAGHEVRIFDNFAQQVHGDGIPAYLSSELEVLEGDMRDSMLVERAISGIDLI